MTKVWYNDGKGDCDDKNVGWWWCFHDGRGSQESSEGPFATEEEAKEEADLAAGK